MIPQQSASRALQRERLRAEASAWRRARVVGRVSECQCSHRLDEHDEHGCKRRKCQCVPLVFCACGHDDFHHVGANGQGLCRPCEGECDCKAFTRVNPPVLCGVCAP